MRVKHFTFETMPPTVDNTNNVDKENHPNNNYPAIKKTVHDPSIYKSSPLLLTNNLPIAIEFHETPMSLPLWKIDLTQTNNNNNNNNPVGHQRSGSFTDRSDRVDNEEDNQHPSHNGNYSYRSGNSAYPAAFDGTLLPNTTPNPYRTIQSNHHKNNNNNPIVINSNYLNTNHNDGTSVINNQYLTKELPSIGSGPSGNPPSKSHSSSTLPIIQSSVPIPTLPSYIDAPAFANFLPPANGRSYRHDIIPKNNNNIDHYNNPSEGIITNDLRFSDNNPATAPPHYGLSSIRPSKPIILPSLHQSILPPPNIEQPFYRSPSTLSLFINLLSGGFYCSANMGNYEEENDYPLMIFRLNNQYQIELIDTDSKKIELFPFKTIKKIDALKGGKVLKITIEEEQDWNDLLFIECLSANDCQQWWTILLAIHSAFINNNINNNNFLRSVVEDDSPLSVMDILQDYCDLYEKKTSSERRSSIQMINQKLIHLSTEEDNVPQNNNNDMINNINGEEMEEDINNNQTPQNNGYSHNNNNINHNINNNNNNNTKKIYFVKDGRTYQIAHNINNHHQTISTHNSTMNNSPINGIEVPLSAPSRPLHRTISFYPSPSIVASHITLLRNKLLSVQKEWQRLKDDRYRLTTTNNKKLCWLENKLKSLALENYSLKKLRVQRKMDDAWKRCIYL